MLLYYLWYLLQHSHSKDWWDCRSRNPGLWVSFMKSVLVSQDYIFLTPMPGFRYFGANSTMMIQLLFPSKSHRLLEEILALPEHPNMKPVIIQWLDLNCIWKTFLWKRFSVDKTIWYLGGKGGEKSFASLNIYHEQIKYIFLYYYKLLLIQKN